MKYFMYVQTMPAHDINRYVFCSIAGWEVQQNDAKRITFAKLTHT